MQGYLARTSQGRVAMKRAYEKIGLPAPVKPQGDLFDQWEKSYSLPYLRNFKTFSNFIIVSAWITLIFRRKPLILSRFFWDLYGNRIGENREKVFLFSTSFHRYSHFIGRLFMETKIYIRRMLDCFLIVSKDYGLSRVAFPEISCTGLLRKNSSFGKRSVL